jgi:hypothetical protein
MKSKIVLRLALFSLALLLTGNRSHAAIITWGPATTITNDTDVSTSGTAAYAYNWSGINQILNGVTFSTTGIANGTTADGNLTLSGFGGVSSNGYTSASAPFANLSPAYQATLQGADYLYSATSSTVTITLNRLTSGDTYTVQVWVCDPSISSAWRDEILASGTNGVTNCVTLDYNVNHSTGGVGQYATGIFTADAPTQSFTITGDFIPPNGHASIIQPQLHAIQLRDTTATLASNPTNITSSVSGGTLNLSWPADHLGWLLQVQTNTAGAGLNTNGWVTMPGSDQMTATNITITKTNPAVFYRLAHP